MKFNYPYVESDPLQHFCITEPLRRGTASVLHDSEHALLVLDHPSCIYFLSADNLQSAQEAMQDVQDCSIVLLCNAEHEPIADALGLNGRMRCVQAAYLREDLPEPDPRLQIAVADDAGFAQILKHYDMESPEALAQLRASGMLFFARDEVGEDVGFVGLHTEGCFGLLEIFENQRGKGYGKALESFILRFARSLGGIPYCQIKTDNHASMSLQRKLGMTIGEKEMLFAWKED